MNLIHTFSKMEKSLPVIIVKEIIERRTISSGSIHFQAIDNNCLGLQILYFDYPQMAMTSGISLVYPLLVYNLITRHIIFQ